MKILISISILTLLMAASCRKNKTTEQLPPETHEGKFTFGCKVDGKIYTASGKGGLLSTEYIKYGLGSTDSSINIFAGNTGNTKPKFSIALIIKYLGKTGTYLMKSYPYEGMFMNTNNGTIPGGSNTFTTTETHVGTLNIKYFNGTFYPYNEGVTLSGTFEMDAINEEGNVVHITDGRFDIGH